ncbi:MAG: GNAT family N-acetyltransferase [Defluviitaleaceae bacterium]|nr:GNAT family N-acetyltransferase [Defluviitaleaceae bacterium]
MDLTFELLSENDIPQIREIIEGFMEYDPEQIRAFLSEKQNYAFVPKLGDKVVGLIYGYSLTRMDGKSSQFFIYSVDIHPDYQDRGYGSQFALHVVDWARDNGFSESFVITDRDKPRACRVYEKAGMKFSENDCDRTYVIEYGEYEYDL